MVGPPYSGEDVTAYCRMTFKRWAAGRDTPELRAYIENSKFHWEQDKPANGTQVRVHFGGLDADAGKVADLRGKDEGSFGPFTFKKAASRPLPDPFLEADQEASWTDGQKATADIMARQGQELTKELKGGMQQLEALARIAENETDPGKQSRLVALYDELKQQLDDSTAILTANAADYPASDTRGNVEGLQRLSFQDLGDNVFDFRLAPNDQANAGSDQALEAVQLDPGMFNIGRGAASTTKGADGKQADQELHRAILFLDKKTGEATVTFQQTQFGSDNGSPSMSENAQNMRGDPSTYFDNAEALALYLKDMLPGVKLRFTGASFGGGLAKAAAHEVGGEAVILNASPVSRQTLGGQRLPSTFEKLLKIVAKAPLTIDPLLTNPDFLKDLRSLVQPDEPLPTKAHIREKDVQGDAVGVLRFMLPDPLAVARETLPGPEQAEDKAMSGYPGVSEHGYAAGGQHAALADTRKRVLMAAQQIFRQ